MKEIPVMTSTRFFYMDEREYLARSNRMKLIAQENGFLELFTDSAEVELDLLEIKGNTGIISINSGMVRQKDFFSAIFGDISFGEIISAIERANANPDIETIQLNFNTPGGEINGVDEVAMAVRNSPKKTVAFVDEMLASAGVFIGSQADQIIASSPNAQIGSIGVLMILSAGNDDNILTLTSTQAPNKRPDLKTAQGQDVLIKELDDLHAVFAARVAEGRGVTVEKVNSDFGKGGMLIAADALAVGLIDGVNNAIPTDKDVTLKKDLAIVKANVAVGQDENLGYNADKKLTSKNEIKDKGVRMSDNTELDLKAKYDAGYANGVTAERERVSALQNWGLQNPSTVELVNEAIASGKTDRDIHAQMLAAITKSISTPTVEDTPPLISAEVETSPAGDEKTSEEKIKADAKRLAALVSRGV